MENRGATPVLSSQKSLCLSSLSSTGRSRLHQNGAVSVLRKRKAKFLGATEEAL